MNSSILACAALAALGLLPLAADATAQLSDPAREPLVVGEVVHLPSDRLGENRPVLVQVPEAEHGEALDVIVVLDAESHGYHVSGIVDFLSHRHVERMPKAIVVGVLNIDRVRDTTPTPTESWPTGGRTRDFAHFLADELLPWIEAEYSTTGRRTLVGHSGSGLAALYSLIETPGAFQSIIAVDPSVDWDEDVFFDDARKAWKRADDLDVRLVLSTYRDKPILKKLEQLLKRDAPRGLTWTWQRFEGETHGSMVHRAVYDGLLELQQDVDD